MNLLFIKRRVPLIKKKILFSFRSNCGIIKRFFLLIIFAKIMQFVVLYVIFSQNLQIYKIFCAFSLINSFTGKVSFQ